MNEIKYISVKQKDGYVTRVTHFNSPNKPKASILILHGMDEHQKRYQLFAQYLTEHDMDVYIYDHRGHGTDKKLSELGFVAADKGYQLLVEDAITVSNYIEQNNRSKKFFLMGHSMGSFIARIMIQSCDKYNGVIICGTAYQSKFELAAALFIASLIKKLKGPKHISPYLNNLLFGRKSFIRLSERTAFDWLSRSHTIVGAYMHDPYCGFTCTASFYNDLIKLIDLCCRKKLIRLTKKELPLFIISGESDPVGGYAKGIKKYISVLKKLGFNNVTSKLYPECRHELLNELNRDDVFADIQQWLSKRI
jgi:alpha-beta hydrolase superfamily lysophospholipase